MAIVYFRNPPPLIVGTERAAAIGARFEKRRRVPTEFARRFPEVEAAFTRKGEEALDRQTAIFALAATDRACMNHAGAPENHVYLVRPEGREVLRCDYGWFSDALRWPRKAKQFAQWYYEGVMHFDHPRERSMFTRERDCSTHSFWEFLCRRVVVVEEIE